MKRYHNLSKLLSITIAICFLPIVLRAAEPEAAAETPARQIKFVLEDEPLEFQVPAELRNAIGQVKLPEGTFYAAVVRGYAPMLIDRDSRGGAVTANQETLRILTLAELTPAAKRLGLLMRSQPGLEDQRRFKFQSRMVDEAPNDVAPLKHAALNEPLLNFVITSNIAGPRENVSLQVERFHVADRPTPTPLQEYDFVAGTIEDAKRIAQDFLAVHDDIFVRHLIVATKKAKADLTAARADIQPKLAEANEQYAAAQRELKDIEPLAETAVNDLKVKRTLLKVELAGIKARVKTISGKLLELSEEEHLEQGKPLQTRRRDQLVDLKVAADIDLASVAAQQEVLEELLDGQRRLLKLHPKGLKLRDLKSGMERIERNLPVCDALLADLIPFQLVNETIVIRPVKFVVQGDEAAGR